MSKSVTWDHEVDVFVVGSGAGGLGAAFTAVSEGLRTLVVEKTEFAGGTTSYSAGTVWAPNHRYLREAGVRDDVEQAVKYVDQLVADKNDRTLRLSYIHNASKMIDYLHERGIRFWWSKSVVDYHPEISGAATGRALEPHTFNGRRLGKEQFSRLRYPVPEFALFGGTLMLRRAEVNELLKILRGDIRAVWVALKLGVRWFWDLVTGYPRGTRLAMGNALIAHLLYRFLYRGGEIRYSSTVKELIVEEGGVTGAIVLTGGREVRVRVRRGVVLAGGGFAASREKRADHLPVPTPQFTRANEGATGDSINLGLAAGGALSPDFDDNAFWFPSSIGRRHDGSQVVFPHIWDRARPGVIAVNALGERFVDESISYHRFVRAMYASNRSGAESIPAYLIIDSTQLRKYGLGMIRPGTLTPFLKKYVRQGYIYRSRTVAGLAKQIGVPVESLQRTISRSNGFARSGVDDDFGKGSHAFGLAGGDSEHRPNPNLGAIEVPPYYALPVVPTPLGTSLGLRIDAHARVLNESGHPIRGLYAAGNDAGSPMASEYPGAGGQVGAGLTFGWLAAQDMAGDGA